MNAQVTIKQIVAKMSIKELRQALAETREAIDVFDCFGTRDLIWCDLITKELRNRNIIA